MHFVLGGAACCLRVEHGPGSGECDVGERLLQTRFAVRHCGEDGALGLGFVRGPRQAGHHQHTGRRAAMGNQQAVFDLQIGGGKRQAA